MSHWEDLLQETRQLLAEEQHRHERSRLDKELIPVRTYVTDHPDGGYYKDGAFESALYVRHRAAAVDGFRKALHWVWADDHFELEVPFGANPSRAMAACEVAERAVQWACTKEGLADRAGSEPPLRDLGGVAEVNMAVRIRDHFGADAGNVLALRLTSDASLASLCPLTNWPHNRLMYVLGLPCTAAMTDNVDTFFNTVKAAINNATTPPHFAERRPMIYDPGNPRHAVAAEFAVGFQLRHRSDQENYVRTYRADINRKVALHCLAEEDRASSHFELEFTRDSELYQGLGLNPMVLDPAVVDVLGDKERLELFVNAWVFGMIAQLPKAERPKRGADVYLWPGAGPLHCIRLSKMNTPEEIKVIAGDLVPTEDQVQRVTSDRRVVNRLRLMYALRTFVLLEHDVVDDKHLIDYVKVRVEVQKCAESKGLQERVKEYEFWRDKFLDYYVTCRDSYVALAHLGLVLARVVDDLRNAVLNAEHSAIQP